MQTKTIKKLTFVGATAVAASSIGIAFGAWSSSGSGSGSAASTTSENSVIAGVTPVEADDLYPGAVKDTFVTISNPNDYPVEVTAISAGSSRLVGSCAADSVRTDAATATSPGALTRSDVASTVIAGNGSGTYKLTLRMANDAADACKSQSFVIGLGGAPASDMTAVVRSAASTTGNGF
jgi:hypothetical protein